MSIITHTCKYTRVYERHSVGFFFFLVSTPLKLLTCLEFRFHVSRCIKESVYSV